jgi:hypothetical protein
MMEQRFLLVAVAVLLAVIAALLGGIVKTAGGAGMADAIQAGATTFAATLTLAIVLMSAVGLV